MSDSFYLGRKVKTADIGPVQSQYSKVVINIDDEHAFTAGDDTGRTLEFTCPWGTQQMAEDVLTRVSGYAYAPYEADGAILNPAAELGDGVTITGATSGIFSRTLNFNSAMFADIAAPQSEDIDHEYPYQSSAERAVQRQISQVKATLRVNAESIEARVEKTGGAPASFGWVLDETAHIWTANGQQVMKITQNGLEVSGKVTATSGTIGGCEIENGVLKVGSANISSISADSITVGTLNVDRIQERSITGSKIGQGEITGGYYSGGSFVEGEIATNGIVNGNIASGSIWNSTLSGGCVSNVKLDGNLQDAVAEALYAKRIFAGSATANIFSTNLLFVGGNECVWIGDYLRKKAD